MNEKKIVWIDEATPAPKPSDWVDWAKKFNTIMDNHDVHFFTTSVLKWSDFYGTANRKQEPHAKRDNMWIVRNRDDRQWHDYYPQKWTRTHTVTEVFRYEGGKGRRAGSAGFQPYRIERDEHGQYKFHAIGKPLKTLQQAKDFVEVFVRLSRGHEEKA